MYQFSNLCASQRAQQHLKQSRTDWDMVEMICMHSFDHISVSSWLFQMFLGLLWSPWVGESIPILSRKETIVSSQLNWCLYYWLSYQTCVTCAEPLIIEDLWIPVDLYMLMSNYLTHTCSRDLLYYRYLTCGSESMSQVSHESRCEFISWITHEYRSE